MIAPYGVVVLVALTALLLMRGNSKPEVVTAYAAIATLSVNLTFDAARRRSDERRWYAERFLPDKLESLKTLFAALHDWKFAANYYANFTPATWDTYRTELVLKEEPFLTALARAQIYLNTDDDATIRAAMGQLRLANRAVYFALPDTVFPGGRRPNEHRPETMFSWVDFESAMDGALACIRRHLNPRTLQDIERELA